MVTFGYVKGLGIIMGIAGFGLLIGGEAALLGTWSQSALRMDLFLSLGLALIIIGCGIFGYDWIDSDTPIVKLDMTLTGKAKLSLLATFISTVIVVVLALWACATDDVLWTVIAVGALGGLVHEIVQSKGTAFAPAKSGASTGNPNSGEDYLGGMVGIILGGAAGLLALSATGGSLSTITSSSPITISLIATVFASGIALKGISDSAAGSPAQ